ncbi:MAG: LLM class F420-dependent oxidoreductase [Actinobacteria bacterium]|nr:LLM class F420-dependent oxidoreductase [Actinomycetota bacterium]
MKASCSFANFTWDGGPAQLGPVIAETARVADEAGFSALSAMDHWFQIEVCGPPENEMLEGYSVLAFAAAVTSRLELQLLVTGVTYRHPGLLAKTVTTLDVLSGGRGRLGIGAAWFEEEHDGLGVPYPSTSERFERLDETLQIYRQMCSDDESAFHGKHYQLARTLNSPQPLSTPYPEIMVGGMGPNKTLKIAARHAQSVNWFPVGVDRFAELREVLARHCEEANTNVDDIRITMMAVPPNDVADTAALDKFLAFLGPYATFGVDEVFLSPTSGDPATEVARWGDLLVPRLAELG